MRGEFVPRDNVNRDVWHMITSPRDLCRDILSCSPLIVLLFALSSHGTLAVTRKEIEVGV